MDTNVTFKNAAFGGYHKQAVNDYLEKVRSEIAEKEERIAKGEETMTIQADELLNVKQYLYEIEKRHQFLEENYSRTWSAAQNRIASLNDENKRLSEQMEQLRADLQKEKDRLSQKEEDLLKREDALSKITAAQKEKEAQIEEEVEMLEKANDEIARRKELAEKHIETAKAEAKRMKAQAKEEADEIIREANKEADELRAKVWKETRKDAYPVEEKAPSDGPTSTLGRLAKAIQVLRGEE
ncbi:MAG: hypothetical protein IJ744_12135 [Lachnospiraceae bacterium]|nr:hypothetical protein [Lachnospiraceae bacterium]